MMIADATMRAMDTIARREREALDTTAFTVKAPKDSFLIAARQNAAPSYLPQATLSIQNGALVDDSGAPVLGYDRPDSPLHELRVDPADVALGFTQSMRVDTDGSVRYQRIEIDPQSGRNETVDEMVGKIALARFPTSSTLAPASAGRFVAPGGVMPFTGTPGDGTFGPMSAASHDMQRVDVGFERLQEAYLAFDALRAAGKAHGSLDKTAMDLLK